MLGHFQDRGVQIEALRAERESSAESPAAPTRCSRPGRADLAGRRPAATRDEFEERFEAFAAPRTQDRRAAFGERR